MPGKQAPGSTPLPHRPHHTGPSTHPPSCGPFGRTWEGGKACVMVQEAREALLQERVREVLQVQVHLRACVHAATVGHR